MGNGDVGLLETFQWYLCSSVVAEQNTAAVLLVADWFYTFVVVVYVVVVVVVYVDSVAGCWVQNFLQAASRHRVTLALL